MKRKILVLGFILAFIGSVSAGIFTDGFEDQDFTNSPSWNDNSCCITPSVTSFQAYQGSYSLKLFSNDGGQLYFDRSSLTDIETGDNFYYWIRPASTGDLSGYAIGDGTSNSVYSIDDGVFGGINTNGEFFFRAYDGSNRIEDIAKGSYSADNWYKIGFTFDIANDEANYFAKSSSGSTLVSGTMKISSTFASSQYIRLQKTGFDSGDVFFDNVAYKVQNSLPQFNSTSVQADPPLIAESVNYSAEVFDSDGNVTELSLTVFKDGSQVFHDSVQGQASYNWNDVYVPQSDGSLDARFKATDDAGATTTEWLNRTLTDDAPSVNIGKPGNTTYFKYDVPLEFQASDSDSNPDEEYSCDIEKDGALVQEVHLVEGVNNTGYDTTVQSDLGAHNVSVSCTDGSGNTGQASQSYTVKAFELQSTSGDSTVFETENSDFDFQGKYGEMVNNVELDLVWNSSTADSTELSGLSGVSTFSETLTKTDVPLVNQNDTAVDWKFDYTVNRTEFQSSSYNQTTENSSVKSQSIYHAFYFNKQSLDKSKYLERDLADYNATLVNKTGKASVTGDVTTNVTQMLVGLDLRNVSGDESVYGSSVQLPSVDSEEKKIFFDLNFTVEFKGDERVIDPANVERDLYRFDITDCGGGNPVALDFETYYEFDQSKKATTQLDWAASVWNEGSPDFKRTVNFSSQGKKSHEYCVSPSWAELRVDNTDKLLQYFSDSADFVRRSYFLMNESVDNTTTTIPLYTNYRNRTNRVSITIEDGEGNGVPDTIVTFERYFPAKDKYITTAMTRTGSQGESETFLEVNEIYYQFKFFQDGELIEEKPPQTVPDSLELFFELGEDVSSGYYDVEGKVEYDCNLENTTSFSCGYSGPESIKNITLKVEKREQIGYSTKCSVSSTSSNGRLICRGLNTTSDRYKYSLTAFYPTQSVSVTTGYIGQLTNSWAQAGLFVYFMLFITTSFAGLWRPEASIALGMLSTLIAYVVGFLVVTQTAVISMLAVGVALIWRMS